MKVTPAPSDESTSFHVTRTTSRKQPVLQAPMVAILSDHVKVCRQGRSEFVDCSIRLTDRYLCIMYSQENNNAAEHEPHVYALPVADIIGCHLLDHEHLKSFSSVIKCGKTVLSNKACYFRVIAYPSKNPPKLSFSKCTRRVRRVLIFAIDKFPSEIENRNEVVRWTSAVRWLRDERRSVAECFSDRMLSMPGKSKRLLVMVNPAAGPGRAGIIFQDHVAPLLAEAGIAVTLFVSTSSGGASDYIISSDVRKHFDGIVIISGDGLIFEVVNGLMRREDWVDAIQIPLGIIPGGSGNGLAFSINYAVGEFAMGNPILASTLNVIHGRRTPLDLVQVTTRKETLYSFLSIGWGLLADMDIESERLRFMGGFRFTVYGIIRTFVLKKYRGRLSFLPVPAFAKNRNPFSGRTKIQEHDAGTQSGRQASAFLPPLLDPVPEDWTVIDGDFVMVYTAHTSHMSSDCFLAPSARLDDGVIWLLYLTGNLSKSQVLSFLISLESGKHVDLPYVNMLPVRAFRLEPLDDMGVLTIDGERIKTGPVQARVLPSVANVMSR